MVKQFIPQVEADQATEMLRAMQYPLAEQFAQREKRMWIACQVVDLALDDETNVQLEGEDIHVTLARAIVEKANSVKLPVEIHGRITAIPVGNPFNAISVCVDGKEAYQLTDITTVGEAHEFAETYFPTLTVEPSVVIPSVKVPMGAEELKAAAIQAWNDVVREYGNQVMTSDTKLECFFEREANVTIGANRVRVKVEGGEPSFSYRVEDQWIPL